MGLENLELNAKQKAHDQIKMENDGLRREFVILKGQNSNLQRSISNIDTSVIRTRTERDMFKEELTQTRRDITELREENHLMHKQNDDLRTLLKTARVEISRLQLENKKKLETERQTTLVVKTLIDQNDGWKRQVSQLNSNLLERNELVKSIGQLRNDKLQLAEEKQTCINLTNKLNKQLTAKCATNSGARQDSRALSNTKAIQAVDARIAPCIGLCKEYAVPTGEQSRLRLSPERSCISAVHIKQQYTTKLEKCERSRSEIFQKYYAYLNTYNYQRYISNDQNFQQTYRIKCLQRKLSHVHNCLQQCSSVRCMRRCSR